ncbi:hypothetical protein CL176_02820 [Suicoccus acidiformans]|uniref:Acyl-CoA synthetase FdrA n=1 Tax=Suicoccus acidiformans TaxID=2036206 RepID=A0A347WIY8_9LACT|nr:DUF1116 domain-containing protein [Suicoccus acidiformans]AXY25045.1 hypothetical protein CL176_02820 [Suicoccus acidiformans]
MLLTNIQKGNYQDSINLMLLSTELNNIEGVIQAQVMMATDANKDIFKGAGLETEELLAAGANDMAIVIETKDPDIMDNVLNVVEDYLSDLSVKKDTDSQVDVDNWDDAMASLPDANLAVISIPGAYAASEIERALDKGLHVFSFSDNVALKDEVRLKEKAHEKGLMLMGPDCGTGIISGVPIAFTNVVTPGNIGIIGASGTGIQEVTTIIDRLGGGVMHAIGTGGRDLSEAVSARTMLDAIAALENHPMTDVITIISKPPAKEVRDKVVKHLQSLTKPVVAIFLGEKPKEHIGNVYFAYTLEEAAKISVDLANGEDVQANYYEPITYDVAEPLQGKTVKGLYSGGTLANEAATLIADALKLGEIQNKEGYILDEEGYQVMDLGDDIYTQGKPHPMIDPSVRVDKLQEVVEDESTGVILFDVVLGYGSHADMANALIPSIQDALAKAKEDGRDLYFVATVVGTENDPQDYAKAKADLEEAGVLVEATNARAVRLALKLMGVDYQIADKAHVSYDGEVLELEQVSGPIQDLITTQPRVINVGVSSFTESIERFGGKVVQYNWRPRAGGNAKLIKVLDAIDKHAEEIDAANAKVVNRMRDAQPFLVDVRYAKEVIPELNTNEKVILHAGPPIKYENMTGPMQGSCIGAMLFEGWADDHEDARKQLETGEVTFIPCHHVNAVGPMGGITTANFPVFVVREAQDGTEGYCIMNEGIGTVLRFGANNEEVVTRLEWMRDVLGPVLGQALRTIEGGLNTNIMIARAIGMGDEFHQRNIAASLVFLKEIAPAIVSLNISEELKQEVIQFLADTDQFFLNIAMATGKTIVDYARKVQEGCIVTTMSRNGENFGIRIAALGDEWFTAPVNTPDGLYFTGYSADDANKDIGDSAITETIGLGGSAMIAAPGVTRFIGAGGFEDAVRISEEQARIVVDQNPNWAVPTWNFRGTNLGIDIRKVVETGIEPIINTGIAHKEAGVGQVGAGTVTAPVEAFEKALVAYAEHLGIDVDSL